MTGPEFHAQILCRENSNAGPTLHPEMCRLKAATTYTLVFPPLYLYGAPRREMELWERLRA